MRVPVEVLQSLFDSNDPDSERQDLVVCRASLGLMDLGISRDLMAELIRHGARKLAVVIDTETDEPRSEVAALVPVEASSLENVLREQKLASVYNPDLAVRDCSSNFKWVFFSPLPPIGRKKI